MKAIRQFLKEDFSAMEPYEVAGSPVTVLIGCDEPVALALKELGIVSVFDLATSKYFMAALEVCEAVEGNETVFFKYGKPNPDRFNDEALSMTLAELRNASILVLQDIGPVTAAKLTAALHIQTVREMAFFSLFQNARVIVDEAYDIPEMNDDPDAPKELLPEMGGYATEKYYYNRVFLYDTGDTLTKSTQQAEGSLTGNTHTITGPLSLEDIEAETHLFHCPGFGAVMTMEQCWYPQAVTLGHLLHCLALAPAETTRIAVVDWSRKSSAELADESSQIESLANTTEQNRSIGEITSGVANEVQNGGSDVTTTTTSGGASTSGGVGLNLGIVNLKFGAGGGVASTKTHVYGSSYSNGTRSASSEMMQNIRSSTQQNASSARTRRASVIHEVSQSENVDLKTRMVVNYNHSHALTINYYEVVQMYRVITRLHECTRCIFIPLQLLDFSREKVITKYRSVLAAAALDEWTLQLLQYPGDKYVMKMELRATGLAKYQDQQMLQRIAAAGVSGAAEEGFWRLPDDTLLDGIELRPMFTSGYWERHDPAAPESVKIRHVYVYMRNDGSVPREFTVQPGSSFARSTDGQPVRMSEIASIRIDMEKGTVHNVMDANFLLRIDGQEYQLHTNVSLPETTGMVTLASFTPPLVSGDLVERLNENRLHYSQAVWNSLDAQHITLLLAPYRFHGMPLASLVDTTLLVLHGNYIVLPFKRDLPGTPIVHSRSLGSKLHGIGTSTPELSTLDDDLKKWKLWTDLHVGNMQPEEDVVPVPTGGVFAEAVLGRYNASEKLDLTRFWNWQDSPIPHLSETPQIAPVSGESRQSNETLTPSAFAQPMINITNPPAMPDPTGMSNLLTLLGNGNTFRDMSGLAGIVDLAKTSAAGGNEVAKMSVMAANPSYVGALLNEAKKEEEKKEEKKKLPDDKTGDQPGTPPKNENDNTDPKKTATPPSLTESILQTAAGISDDYNSSEGVATVAGENGGYDEAPAGTDFSLNTLSAVFVDTEGNYLGSVGSIDNIQGRTVSGNFIFDYRTVVVIVQNDSNMFDVNEFKEGGAYYDLPFDVAVEEYNSNSAAQIEIGEISLNEMLNRANWAWGESGATDLLIDSVSIMGVATTIDPTSKYSFYAHAIHNLRNRPSLRSLTAEGFFKRKMPSSYPNYFNGIGGTPPARKFANLRKSGLEVLLDDTNAKAAVAAVIRSFSVMVNETDIVEGRFQWKGNPDAENIKDSTNETWQVLHFETPGGWHHAFHYL